MKKNDSNIHTVVMRRIHRIHTLRALVGGVGVSFVVLAASLYAIGREVWVARVFQNMPHTADVVAVGRFFISAFVSTHAIVQALVLLTVIAFIWMVREGSKLLSQETLRLA